METADGKTGTVIVEADGDAPTTHRPRGCCCTPRLPLDVYPKGQRPPERRAERTEAVKERPIDKLHEAARTPEGRPDQELFGKDTGFKVANYDEEADSFDLLNGKGEVLSRGRRARPRR